MTFGSETRDTKKPVRERVNSSFGTGAGVWVEGESFLCHTHTHTHTKSKYVELHPIA